VAVALRLHPLNFRFYGYRDAALATAARQTVNPYRH
jgi:hypothetical protein